MAGTGAEEGETVIVGETQFGQKGEAEEEDEEMEVEEVVPAKKGARGGAGAKKLVAAKGRSATKKAATGASAMDDFDAALAAPLAGPEGSGAKPSAREKKLEAQLAAVRSLPPSLLSSPLTRFSLGGQTKKALSESQALFKKLSELRETRAEEAEQRLREISDERIKCSSPPSLPFPSLSSQNSS